MSERKKKKAEREDDRREPAPGEEFGEKHPKWREPTEEERSHTSTEDFNSGAFAGRNAPKQEGRDDRGGERRD